MGGGQPLGPHLTGHVQAVDVGQSQVQHDDVSVGDLGEGALAGAVGAHLVALTPEGASQRLGDGRIVFDKKHSRHTYGS